MSEIEITDPHSRLWSAIGGAVQHTANEILILSRLEEFFSPKPTHLVTEGNIETFNSQVDRLESLYGGVPRIIILTHNDPKPKFDTYMSAAINETINNFDRARRSLCRAQTIMIGAHLLGKRPDLIDLPSNDEIRGEFKHTAEDIFWEHVETTLIRLAGFWDRAGQILDFAFFSIRQYERDGFCAVIDRIRANSCPMHPELAASPAWKKVWNYKKSEKEDGLQWLLSRRNLVVHSLHLRTLKGSEENKIFESTFNHLSKRLRENLAPASPEKEIERLHLHLAQAASLLPDVLTLCEMNALSKPGGLGEQA